MLRSLDVLSRYLFTTVGFTNEPPVRVPRVPTSVLLESEGELDELIFTIHLIRWRESAGGEGCPSGHLNSTPLLLGALGFVLNKPFVFFCPSIFLTSCIHGGHLVLALILIVSCHLKCPFTLSVFQASLASLACIYCFLY